MRISSWLTMCSRVLVRWGGMLLSGEWAWSWGEGWGKSSVSVCWVVEGLVLGKWVVLLLLPLHEGATMWSSASLETWEHKSIWFNQKHILDHFICIQNHTHILNIFKTYSEPFVSLLPHYHRGMPSISVMVCVNMCIARQSFLSQGTFSCVRLYQMTVP